MSLRRYANTDAQEESLALVEKICKGQDIPIWYGTAIGKSPQTILLDMSHQGGQARVRRNGSIGVGSKDFPPDEFAKECGVTSSYEIDEADVSVWLDDHKADVKAALAEARAKVLQDREARKAARAS